MIFIISEVTALFHVQLKKLMSPIALNNTTHTEKNLLPQTTYIFCILGSDMSCVAMFMKLGLLSMVVRSGPPLPPRPARFAKLKGNPPGPPAPTKVHR